MTLSKRISELTPSPTLAMNKKAKEMQAEGIDIINLGVGEPDFQTPDEIAEGAIQAIQAQKTSFYTATSGITELKSAIVSTVKTRYNATISPRNVTVTTGGKLSLYALMQTLLDPGDSVVTAAPYWVSYQEQVKLAGGLLEAIQPANPALKLTVADLDALTHPVKVIIINTPTNPTGQVYTRNEIIALLDWANQHDTYIILDEIYGQLVYNDTVFVSGLQIQPVDDSRMIIVDGVSKAYAMTGWRIGWTIADAKIITAMNKLLDHLTSNPTAVAQYAALAALRSNPDNIEKMRLAFEQRLNKTYTALNAVKGLSVALKPQGAFYLFPKVDKNVMVNVGVNSTEELSLKLLNEAHVALPAGEGFGMPGYLRISYAKSQDTLDQAISRLATFFNQY
ncbi:pyridoxal phosphate-dependent aminotransferase [Leuconostoc fallax]|uniref:Aminotransferase n=1 Tax=Leuconostoc fallax TaxID=1251 RepID=A0A4R5N8K3_9LACO|nr:pyridoxal phosphate-dependent aminotransferase [Leuconostoc fallax]MBU7455555.1 pyridoxal phosphate-dependent aminotransferase [Leuconostoc fallax]TDG68197.1 hypothetical protein C5L23_000503 [Leuconostoc fallax]